MGIRYQEKRVVPLRCGSFILRKTLPFVTSKIAVRHHLERFFVRSSIKNALSSNIWDMEKLAII